MLDLPLPVLIAIPPAMVALHYALLLSLPSGPLGRIGNTKDLPDDFAHLRQFLHECVAQRLPQPMSQVELMKAVEKARFMNVDLQAVIRDIDAALSAWWVPASEVSYAANTRFRSRKDVVRWLRELRRLLAA